MTNVSKEMKRAYFIIATCMLPLFTSRSSKTDYIDDNIRSLEVVHTQRDLQEIEKGLSNIRIQGARLSESLPAWSE